MSGYTRVGACLASGDINYMTFHSAGTVSYGLYFWNTLWFSFCGHGLPGGDA